MSSERLDPEERGATAPGRWLRRIAVSWANLDSEQRLAAIAAVALWVTLLLPWYHKNVTESNHGRLQAAGHNVTGFGAFSFVEAAVLLVSFGVLAMLFARGERRPFHLPGGDGLVVMLAGGWTALLVFYRMLDTPSLSQHGGSVVTDVGPQWGIFLSLLAAGALAYAGWRMRAASTPEPPLVRRERSRRRRHASAAEDRTVAHGSPPRPAAATRPVGARPRSAAALPATEAGRRGRYPQPPAQLSLEEEPPSDASDEPR